MKNEHKKFANGIINGLNPTQAYLSVYPKASTRSASVSANRLLQNDNIKKFIKENTEKVNKIVQEKVNESIANTEIKPLLTLIRKRELLMRIAEQEHTFEKFVIIQGKPTKVQVKPDATEVLKAIEIDNKMTGDNAPTDLNVNTIPAPIINKK